LINGDISIEARNKVRFWLERNAAKTPDKVLIYSIDQDKPISHGEMLGLARQMARFLKSRNIAPNDRVVLLSNNSIEHLAVYYSVLAFGATICTVHVEMNAAHLSEIIKSVAPKLILVESGLDVDRAEIGAIAETLDLGDWLPGGGSGLFAELGNLSGDPADAPINEGKHIASIFYTSGTTAKPKGILCSFNDLCENAEGACAAFGIGEGDRILDYRSFNWMSAQTLSGLGSICAGATLLLAQKFSQSRFFGWIKDLEATIAAGNPTVINMLINRPVEITRSDFKQLRFVTSSSAPLLVGDWQKFEDMYGIEIAQGFGSSETGWIAGANEGARRIGSVGKPIPYQNVKIVDGDGKQLPAGAPGSIELGDGKDRLFAYLGDDGAPQIGGVGRFKTGDLGYLDEDGFLFVSGREKDLIIRGGINISPVEVDNILIGLKGVAEAATIGVPDDIYGEEVVAYVALEDGADITPEDILAALEGQMPEAKLPKTITIRDSLPKTERGKLDRQALRNIWEKEKGGP